MTWKVRLALLLILCVTLPFVARAGTPISGLDEITGPAAGDLAVIVDVSDPTMAAAGTNKKITVQNLLGFVDCLTTQDGTPSTLCLTDDETHQTLLGSLGSTYFKNQTGNFYLGDASNQYTSIRHGIDIVDGLIAPAALPGYGPVTQKTGQAAFGLVDLSALGGTEEGFLSITPATGSVIVNPEFLVLGPQIGALGQPRLGVGDGAGNWLFTVDANANAYVAASLLVGSDTPLVDTYGAQVRKTFVFPDVGGGIYTANASNIISRALVNQGNIQNSTIYGMTNILDFQGTGNITLSNAGVLNSTAYLNQHGTISELEGSITGFVFDGANDTTVEYLVGFIMGVFDSGATGTKHVDYAWDTYISPLGLATTTIDERVGIKIADISGDATTTWGIQSATDMQALDGVAWTFGTDRDISIYHNPGDGDGSWRVAGDIVNIQDASAAKPDLQITSTNAGASGPKLTMSLLSASPADSDQLGLTTWQGKDDGGTTTAFCRMEAQSADVTDTDECGWWQLMVLIDGVNRNVLEAAASVTAGSSVITLGASQWDKVAVATDLEVSGSMQAADYYSGDGTQGITDSTSYWLCTAADCSSTCQVTIEDGLIVGCP